MPAILNIPPQYVNGFKELYQLDDAYFESIIEGLSITSLASSVRKLSKIVTSADQSKNELVEEIFLSVGSLTRFIEKGIHINEIVDNIYSVLINELSEEWHDGVPSGLSELEGKILFTKRLTILLKTERLYYAAKANDLMYEYQNVYIQSKALTDIRPVFSAKMDETPKGGMIIHNLHIHYQSERESEHKDIYLAMDSEDLKNLKDILARAEKKEKSLQIFFEKSGMINLNE